MSQRDTAYQPRGNALGPVNGISRRSFRTPEWFFLQTQGCTQGWYARPRWGGGRPGTSWYDRLPRQDRVSGWGSGTFGDAQIDSV